MFTIMTMTFLAMQGTTGVVVRGSTHKIKAAITSRLGRIFKRSILSYSLRFRTCAANGKADKQRNV